MRAIVYHRYGGPDELQLREVAEPKVPQNSILVKVAAAGVNPADLALRAGLAAGILSAWFPVIPGWDVAGTVEQVGAGVSEFTPGDEVIGYLYDDILHSGTYAEKVAGPVDRFVRKPARLDWAQAAAVPLAGLTAIQAIDWLDPRRGETLLIHGASGGVGSMATQLAVERGARVIGTSSDRNAAYLQGLGAVPVLRDHDIVDEVRRCASQGVDAVLDCYGHGSLSATQGIVGPRTRVASIADGGPGIHSIFARPRNADLVRIAQLIELGKLDIRVSTYPLAEAADAHRAIERGGVTGRVVLTT